MFSALAPGLDIKPLLTELQIRVSEELDYRLEAQSQETFAEAYDGDAEIRIPHVVAGREQVLVTEWIDGIPLARIIAGGDRAQRDRAGYLLALLHFSAPQRSGLLHADPHPGNFRLLPDGRLGVIDFGAVARLPGGLPEPIGRLVRLALEGDAEAVLTGLRGEGFVRPDLEVDAARVLRYLRPMLKPLERDTFQFTRTWMRAEAARIADPRNEAAQVGRQLNLPPTYLLIHRVTLGGIGVLCQLGAEVPVRGELQRWVPGFSGD